MLLSGMMNRVVMLPIVFAVVETNTVILHLPAEPVRFWDPFNVGIFPSIIFGDICRFLVQPEIAAESCIPVIQVKTGIPQPGTCFEPSELQDIVCLVGSSLKGVGS